MDVSGATARRTGHLASLAFNVRVKSDITWKDRQLNAATSVADELATS